MTTYLLRIKLEATEERFLREIKNNHGLSYNDQIVNLIRAEAIAYHEARKPQPNAQQHR